MMPRNPRMVLPVVTTLLTLIAAGCQDVRMPPMPSELDWAHYGASSLLAGGLGRVIAAERGLAGDDRQVRVCVESGNESYPLASAVLETKLAWATWLDGAGIPVDEVWSKLQFETAETCGGEAPLDAATRFLGPSSTAASLEADGSANYGFSPLAITCETEGNQRRCQGSSMTTGLGRPGSYSSWSRAGQWVRVEFSTATSARLSPWVDWITLGEELAIPREDEAFNMEAQKLKNTYADLLAQQEPSSGELVAFARSLRDIKAIGSADTKFSEAAQQFYRSGEESLSSQVRPRKAAWHTLLHEIGHTFGIDHAHDPSRDSVTGPSESTRQNENGQWVTDVASMSYDAEYLYLTADDVAGVQSAKSSIEAFIKEKFGN